MMNRARIVGLMLMLMLLGLSCSMKKESPSDAVGTFPDEMTVAEMYNYYIMGQYDKYVDQMESADEKPKQYRQQMVNLMRQKHQQEEEERRGGPLSCRVVKMEPYDTAYCNAYIEVTYKDHSYEQVLMEMVKKDGIWRLK